MASNCLVKMEYPFPANNAAQLCFMWNMALDQIRDEDFETDYDLECAVNQTMGELIDQCKIQERSFVDSANDLVESIDYNVYQGEQLIKELWEHMRCTSNYIRCLSTVFDIDGEMYGLSVLMDAIAEDV